MPAVQRGYVDGPQGQIHYCDSGGEGPALLLFHQAPLSMRQFDRVYPILAGAGLRVVGADLPGLGMSDVAGSDGNPPSIEDYAGIAPCLMDALGIDAAHLCGHHTGAMVAVEVSLRWPQRVRSLMLSGPAPLTAEEQQEFLDTLVAQERAYEPEPGAAHLLRQWTRRIAYTPEDVPDGASLCTGYLLQTMMAQGPFWYGHNAAFTYDMTGALHRVTHPTLVIANTGDMIYHLTERTLALCPHFECRELAGGGVDPTDLLSQEWSAVVVDFVRSRDSAAPAGGEVT